MKYVPAIALLIVAGAFGMAERTAHRCGGGILPLELPFGTRGEWFNGTFWLNDAEGLGLISPPRTTLDDGSEIELIRVSRYHATDPFVVEVESSDGGAASIRLTGDGEGRVSKTRADSGAPAPAAGPPPSSGDWVSVLPSDCLFGRFAVVRTILLLIGGVILVSAYRWRLRRSERDREIRAAPVSD